MPQTNKAEDELRAKLSIALFRAINRETHKGSAGRVRTLLEGEIMQLAQTYADQAVDAALDRVVEAGPKSTAIRDDYFGHNQVNDAWRKAISAQRPVKEAE